MKLAELFAAARERQGHDYLDGHIHAYCDNQGCTAREIKVRIKTYGTDDPVMVKCPLCFMPAIPDIFVGPVETSREHDERIQRNARQNVNIQRYLKQHGGMTVPASVLFDDSL